MTEMQWSCKTTAFHIALPYSLYQAERVVLMECLPVFMFAAIFNFVLLPHDICSQSVECVTRAPCPAGQHCPGKHSRSVKLIQT